MTLSSRQRHRCHWGRRRGICPDRETGWQYRRGRHGSLETEVFSGDRRHCSSANPISADWKAASTRLRREVQSVTVKVISWNIDGRAAPWHRLIAMDADVALLQEAGEPPQDLVRPIDVDPAPWRTAGWLRWPRRTAIARLSDRVNVEWIEAQSLVDADAGEFAVSRPGTLTAAIVMAPDTEPFVVVSMYSLWEKLHASVRSSWRIVSDASAHRVVLRPLRLHREAGR